MARRSRRKERARDGAPASAGYPLRPAEAGAPFGGSGIAPALIVAALFILVFAIYAQVRTHAFINFDDPMYVSNNDHVLHGLTWPGVWWAFTHVYAANWHPLTWISHMIDVQLFGLNAGAHLLVSVSIHALNSVLLFLFLRMATGSLWRSAAVAALFAVHPLHVESVAWISERKDTLSGLFFLLCLLAYTAYVLKRSRAAYAGSVIALALGLMAKPMLVTTPFVLLLLDYWPFHRIEPGSWRRRIVEKIPFALCIVPSVIATLFAQREAMPTTAAVPPMARLANAGISYVRYVMKTVWPAGLSVMYPFPARIDPRLAAICGLLVIAATVAAYRVRRKLPSVFVGWCWFAGMLVPVIGIVQVGIQAMADRYTYLPHIGLFMAIVWTIAHFAQNVPQLRLALPVTAGVVIVLLAAVAHAQAGYWAGSVPLFEHALAVTSSSNKLAHVNLGGGLVERGEYEAAEREFRLGEGYKPADDMYIGLALALSGQGKLDAAADAARRALDANPNSADAAGTLGSIELARGDNTAATRALARSLNLRQNPSVAANLSRARGDMPGARAQLAQAIALHPANADLHSGLGAVLARLGDDQSALAEYVNAIQLNPRFYDARMDYGALLSRLGRDQEAAQQFAEAGRIRPHSAEPHVYLALLHANQHRFDLAAQEVQTAMGIDHDASNRVLINAIRIPARPTAIDEYLVFLRQQNGGH